jgi:hypothetical protein
MYLTSLMVQGPDGFRIDECLVLSRAAIEPEPIFAAASSEIEFAIGVCEPATNLRRTFSTASRYVLE